MKNKGPLSGVKIVDLTAMVSGPTATMMLGDQGADVIKIEPLEGELMRKVGTYSETSKTPCHYMYMYSDLRTVVCGRGSLRPVTPISV